MEQASTLQPAARAGLVAAISAAAPASSLPLWPRPVRPLYRPADLLAILRAHWLVASLALVAGLAGGLLMLPRAGAPAFTATALVGFPTPDAAAAAASRLGDPALADAVVRRLGPLALFPDLAITPLPSPAATSAPGTPAVDNAWAVAARRLSQGLSVRPVGPEALKVAFTTADPAAALRGLRASLHAWLPAPTAPDPDTARQVARAQAALSVLDQKIAQVRTLYQVGDINQDLTAAADRAEQLRQDRDTAITRSQTLGAELAAAQAQLAAEPDRVFASQDSATRPDSAAQAELLRLELARAHMAAVYAAGYPGLAELDRKIALARAAVARADMPAIAATQEARNPLRDVLHTQIAGLQVKAAGLDRRIADLRPRLRLARARLVSLQEASGELARLEEQRGVAVALARQAALRQEADAARESARLAAPAPMILRPAALLPTPRQPWLWPLLECLLAGLAASVAAVVVAARRRPTYVVAREAERDLHLPLLADRKLATPGAADPVLADSGADSGLSLVSMLLGWQRAAGPLCLMLLAPEPDANLSADLAALARQLDTAGLRVRALVLDEQGRTWFAGATPRPTALSLWNPRADASDVAASLAGMPALPGLRGAADLVLLAAAGPAGEEAARRLARLPDAHLLLLRSGRSSAAGARALAAAVSARGGWLAGFAFGRPV